MWILIVIEIFNCGFNIFNYGWNEIIICLEWYFLFNMIFNLFNCVEIIFLYLWIFEEEYFVFIIFFAVYFNYCQNIFNDNCNKFNYG